MQAFEIMAAVCTILLGIISFFLVRLVNSIDASRHNQEDFNAKLLAFVAQTNQVLASLDEARKDHEARLRVVEKVFSRRKKTVNEEV